MSKKTRIVLLMLSIVMALTLAFIIPSGALLDEERYKLEDEIWAQEEDLLSFIIPSANAEELLKPLPIDFSPGKKPIEENFTDEGYSDPSIRLTLETREEDGALWRIAYIQIASPTQLRTATAGDLRSSRVALISSMAEKYNAVIACNANYMANDPKKTSFEYRMEKKVRNKFNRLKDTLIIDENGDFHILTGEDKAEQLKAFENAGHTIINAFTFGPALVKNEQLQTIPESYGYNPKGREPRIALGQLDSLKYVIAHAEGRRDNSDGATQQELANFMFNLGCKQAFNFDGGNSATIVYNGGYFQNRSRSNERAQSDMIYFASLVETEGN